MQISELTGVIGAITGTIALVISLMNFFHNRFKVAQDYYAYDRDIAFVEARKKIYALDGDETCYDSEVSSVLSAFHFWGLMVKKRYLPFYLFKSSSGLAVINLYEKLEPTIRVRRSDNPLYAEYFEWLYNKTKRYHKKHKRSHT